MELISAERSREENIRNNREFQMQIGLTKIAENDVVSPPEKKFVSNILNAKTYKLHLGDQEELRNKWKTKEIDMKNMQQRMEFSCKYCYKVHHKARTFPNAGALKLYQRNQKCAIYHVDCKSIDTGNTSSYVQVF